jgi:hypothetical protein
VKKNHVADLEAVRHTTNKGSNKSWQIFEDETQDKLVTSLMSTSLDFGDLYKDTLQTLAANLYVVTNLNHEFPHCPCPHLPLHMLSTVADFTDTLLRYMVTSKFTFHVRRSDVSSDLSHGVKM